MKATEQYFPVVLFITLYKVVLTFESVDGILKWDHSNESHWAVFFGDGVAFNTELTILIFTHRRFCVSTFWRCKRTTGSKNG